MLTILGTAQRALYPVLVLAVGLLLGACGNGGDSAGSGDGAGGSEPSGKIAFVSFRDGEREIYVVNADGSGLKNLTNDPTVPDYDPDWSPDGSEIVFVSERDGGLDIYVMDADGSNVRRLTHGDQAGTLSPKWSPDGTRIAFSGTGTLKVMNANGSNVQTVMDPEPESEAALCRAGSFLGDWSPDGEWITYYAASVTRQIGQICIIRPDGTDMKVLVSEPPAFHVEPAWSPDGETIVYRSIQDNNHEVYVVDVDSGDVRNVSNDPALDLEPTWSPDGGWIAFGSIREAGNFDIFIVREDGTDVRGLAPDPKKDSYPVWTE